MAKDEVDFRPSEYDMFHHLHTHTALCRSAMAMANAGDSGTANKLGKVAHHHLKQFEKHYDSIRRGGGTFMPPLNGRIRDHPYHGADTGTSNVNGHKMMHTHYKWDTNLDLYKKFFRKNK